MIDAGTVLQDRYTIEALIGRGGMGAVFQAYDQRLGARVALKQTLVGGERQLDRAFEREARLLANLRHAALPKVMDFFSDPAGRFLVMEYIPGEDLLELIQRQDGPFPAAQVLQWADQLLDALEYLHSQQPPIVHRDIKPQNIKLTGRNQVVLLDFGLAKGAAAQGMESTAASIYGYTPQYAPLEQIQGAGTGPRSDLYALAATLHHLMTGAAPPDALSRAAALLNGQPDPLRPAHTLSPQVAPAISAVLTRALSPGAEGRPADAAALRAQLRQAQEAQPATGPLATALLPPEEVAARTAEPAAQPAEGALTTRPVAPPPPAAPPSPPSPPAASPQAAPQPGVARRRPPVIPIAIGVALLIAVGAFLLRPRQPGRPESPQPQPTAVAQGAATQAVPPATTEPTPGGAPPGPLPTPGGAPPGPPPGPGGGPEPVARIPGGADGLQVAVDGRGVAHIVWADAARPGRRDIHHAELTPGQRWGEPQVVSGGYERVFGEPQLLARADGQVCIVWVGQRSGAASAVAAVRCQASGGAWSTDESPMDLELAGAQHRAAFTADGEFESAYLQDPGGVFFDGEQLSEGGAEVRGLSLTIDRGGVYHLVWVRQGRPTAVIHRSSTDGGTTWSAAEVVSEAASAPSGSASVAADEGGVLVAWVGGGGVWVREIGAQGGGPPERLGDAAGDIAAVAASPGGATVAWSQGDRLAVAQRTRGGRWLPGQGIGGAGSRLPAVAVAPDGSARVAWVVGAQERQVVSALIPAPPGP